MALFPRERWSNPLFPAGPGNAGITKKMMVEEKRLNAGGSRSHRNSSPMIIQCEIALLRNVYLSSS